ncbi:hypothetical protein AVEN_256704-1 [Araneus ventricosus]|uniref:Uncharacterized protein n=1 Tax=Araneus ventricosus TaxID=182803 RepID=A0A4Y2EFJ0_ARAVE|nr:hypothetical protein AVEN_256704-1 [Araneus ventricosus]
MEMFMDDIIPHEIGSISHDSENFTLQYLDFFLLREESQGYWRTRYNFELYRLYKENQVTQIIRSNRLRWLGHVWRTPENNPSRLHTFKNPGGARGRGRPSTRCLDDTENEIKILKIKNWQRVVLDRLSWKKRAVEASKTCNRLLRS